MRLVFVLSFQFAINIQITCSPFQNNLFQYDLQGPLAFIPQCRTRVILDEMIFCILDGGPEGLWSGAQGAWPPCC